MDFCRSGYTGFVQYVEGDPSAVTLARWYIAAPTATAFPVPHAFGSPIWDEVAYTPTLGWITRPSKRNYYDGRRVNTSDGTRFAGPIEFFQRGAPGPGTLRRGVNGTPVECLTPPYGIALGGRAVPAHAVAGGVKLGGRAVPPPTPGFPCAYCGTYTPATCVVTISGASGPVAFLNGTWPCNQAGIISPCLWPGTATPAGFVNVQRINASTWNVQCGDYLGNTALYQAMVADCITPFVATQLSGGPDFPLTVFTGFA